jgi:uncharacterized protein (DUF1800 family)
MEVKNEAAGGEFNSPMAVETGATDAPVRTRRSGGMTRRAVLGAAIAGGAGVAAFRLLGLAKPATTTVSQGNGATDWISPLRTERAQVQQLLRRATFGAGPAELEKALGDGYSKTVSRLVETPPAQPPPFPAGEMATKGSPLKPAQVQKWWVDQMLTSPTPFAERMTLFWHGHFTSDYRKVGLQSPYVYWQNLTWRNNALGDFRSFLYQVTTDPGMLRYLDLATSTGRSPNENYSRELMELFTMGAGTFSEDDVRNGAKALAGWREPQPMESAKTGVFDPKRAYTGGPITFLGKTARFDTKAVLDQVLAQKATAPFVVRRVLINFAMPSPSDSTVNRLAAGFVKSKWSIRQLMHDVFTSDEFKAASSYRSLVKQPIEFMVSALRAVGAESMSQVALQHGNGMGQTLFDPPDVGGWPLNEAWISSNTVMARVNFVTALIQAVKNLPVSTDAHVQQLDGVLSPATASLLNAASSDQERWTLVLASPEFQLK